MARAETARLALIEARRGPLATLQAVLRAIADCVEEAVSAYFDFEEDDIVVQFETDRFPFRSLSDGQRNMAATAADIAMRCAQLNPQLKNRARLETPGVVLIDEESSMSRNGATEPASRRTESSHATSRARTSPGGWKQHPKTFHPYRRAKADLLERIGGYCSYCERTGDLHIEHVAPRRQRPDLKMSPERPSRVSYASTRAPAVLTGPT
ncbi:MAG: hypothetical protein OXG04_10560 [Acidobacteria bacterium]|nr:hypothetical protein [Acidobacteriota bacterium]